jgi:hypothetical protein
VLTAFGLGIRERPSRAFETNIVLCVSSEVPNIVMHSSRAVDRRRNANNDIQLSIVYEESTNQSLRHPSTSAVTQQVSKTIQKAQSPLNRVYDNQVYLVRVAARRATLSAPATAAAMMLLLVPMAATAMTAPSMTAARVQTAETSR